LEHDNFLEVIQQSWSAPINQTDPAKKITAKLKALRGKLKTWQANFYSLNRKIKDIKLLLSLFETLELLRDLSVAEWNFKNLICDKLILLLKQ